MDIFQENNIKNLNVYHLNGSVKDYYDPYKNRIINNLCEVKDREQIVVPFIFTQSGVKPLTSITMSQRYMLNCMKNSKSVILLLLLDMVLMEMMVI